MGLYQICMSVYVMFACFSATGFPTTLSRKTAEGEILGDKVRQQSLFTTTMMISCGISVVFCLFFYLFKNLTLSLFNDPRCAEMFIYILPALVSTSIYCTARGWFWGKKDFTTYAVSEFFEELLKIAFTIFLLSGVYFGMSNVVALAVAFTVADFISAALLLIMYFKKGNKLRRPTLFREITKSAAPITTSRILASFTTSVSALILPILLTRFGMSTAEATAAYGRASGMAMPLLMSPGAIIGALAVVLIPELASMNAKKQSLGNGVENAFCFANFVSFGFFALFFALGKPLGEALYNDAFAGNYVAISSVLILPMCFNQICVSVLNSLGFESKTFKSSFVGLSLMLLSVFVLPEFIGIYTLTAGLIIYHTVTVIINIFLLKKHAKLTKFAFAPSVVMLLSALTAGSVTMIVYKALSPLMPKWICLLLCITILTCFYLLSSGVVFKDKIFAFISGRKNTQKFKHKKTTGKVRAVKEKTHTRLFFTKIK